MDIILRYPVHLAYLTDISFPVLVFVSHIPVSKSPKRISLLNPDTCIILASDLRRLLPLSGPILVRKKPITSTAARTSVALRTIPLIPHNRSSVTVPPSSSRLCQNAFLSHLSASCDDIYCTSCVSHTRTSPGKLYRTCVCICNIQPEHMFVKWFRNKFSEYMFALEQSMLLIKIENKDV